MKRLMVGTGFVVLLLSTKSHAQTGAVIPPADAGHASQASCVILKRMGRVDRTKSRLYSLGISGKRFRYIEGKLPEGFSFHGKMTDHDVRNLQARGAEVLVLESHYTSEDLKEARANCQAGAGKTPIQADAKAPPAPTAPTLIASTPAPAPKPPMPKTGDSASSTGTTGPAASTPAPAPKLPTGKAVTPKADDSASSTGTTELAASTPVPPLKPPTSKSPAPKTNDSASSIGTDAALLDVSSTPTEADVYIDERFSGRTPATTIILMPGNHKIAIKKNGFVVWQRKFRLPSGHNSVYADLVPRAK